MEDAQIPQPAIEPTTPPLTSHSSLRKKLLIGGVIIFVLFLFLANFVEVSPKILCTIGFSRYCTKPNGFPMNSATLVEAFGSLLPFNKVPQNAAVIIPTPTISSNTNMAAWKTYTDNKYGFEFEYPSSYSPPAIRSTNGIVNFIYSIATADCNQSSNELTARQSCENLIGSFTVNIFNNPQKKDLSTLVKDPIVIPFTGCKNVDSRSKIYQQTFMNQPAFISEYFTDSTSLNGCSDLPQGIDYRAGYKKHTSFLYNGYLFDLVFYTSETDLKKNSESVSTLNQILSTFKFTQ